MLSPSLSPSLFVSVCGLVCGWMFNLLYFVLSCDANLYLHLRQVQAEGKFVHARAENGESLIRALVI